MRNWQQFWAKRRRLRNPSIGALAQWKELHKPMAEIARKANMEEIAQEWAWARTPMEQRRPEVMLLHAMAHECNAEAARLTGPEAKWNRDTFVLFNDTESLYIRILWLLALENEQSTATR